MCNSEIMRKNSSESRKIRKPLMEKKRRDRINYCLEEFKKMLVRNKRAGRPDGRPTKLEKADILERTLDFLRKVIDPFGGYAQGIHHSEERTKSMIASYENLSPPEKQRLCHYLFSDTKADFSYKSSPESPEDNSIVGPIWRPW